MSGHASATAIAPSAAPDVVRYQSGSDEHPALQKAAYCIANATAVLMALYIAFSLDLSRPYWAMFSVFIVSKPVSGAVRAKATFRLVGTLIGASMSVFLVPPLVQSPALLSVACALWISICVFAALQDRTPRSYTFLLAGYSVAVIALPSVNEPTAIFDVAIARVEEISIGIICAAVAHSIFFPRNFADVLRAKAELSTKLSAQAVAGVLARRSTPVSLKQIAAITGAGTDLHTLYSQIGFETSNVPRLPGITTALLDRLALLLPTASLVQRALVALQQKGACSVALRSALDQAFAAAASLAAGGKPDVRAVTTTLMQHAREFREGDTRQSVKLQQLVAVRSAELLSGLAEADSLSAALNDDSAMSRIAQLLPSDNRRPLHRDRALALLSAASAGAATLLACWLWIETGWPEGSIAAQFAAIICSLFATFDNPSKVIGLCVAGILSVLPIAAIYEFAILPGIDGFVMLAVVLTPLLLLFSYLQTVESLEAPALVLAIGFSGALALQETYASDFASFVNANAAEIVGALIALAVLLVFRTIDPLWNARRILRLGRQAIADLAYADPKQRQAWAVLMFDRVGQAAARLVIASTDPEHDLLRDFRIGLNLSDLDRCRKQVGSAVGETIPEPSMKRLNAAVAVMGLRLDLDPGLHLRRRKGLAT